MKILFWAVDLQNDFMNKDGALYVEGAETIKPIVKKLTALAIKYKIQVINTLDWHKETDEEISTTPDFKNTFPSHCIAETNGAKLITELNGNKIKYDIGVNDNVTEEEVVKIFTYVTIKKNKFNVFSGNKLTTEVLNIINPTIVIVYGVSSNICVDFAVRGIVTRGYKVVVVKDAIKELPGTDVSALIAEWKKDCNVQMADYKAVEFYIKMMHSSGDI